jgi:hypothetical protein
VRGCVEEERERERAAPFVGLLGSRPQLSLTYTVLPYKQQLQQHPGNASRISKAVRIGT